jgi:hypothetical protein
MKTTFTLKKDFPAFRLLNAVAWAMLYQHSLNSADMREAFIFNS